MWMSYGNTSTLRWTGLCGGNVEPCTCMASPMDQDRNSWYGQESSAHCHFAAGHRNSGAYSDEGITDVSGNSASYAERFVKNCNRGFPCGPHAGALHIHAPHNINRTTRVGTAVGISVD